MGLRGAPVPVHEGGREGVFPQAAAAPGISISETLCAHIEGPEAVVVADLHLGMEAAAEAQGAFFPGRQKPVLIKRLRRILDRFRPRIVAIAGDFKHNFGRDRRREMDEVRDVFDFLDSRAQVVLTRGNHDNFLKNILPDEPLPGAVELGGCMICHGHREPPGLARFKGWKIMAHEHPALKLRDPVGAFVSAPAFVIDTRERTLVLPALGPLAAGADVVGKAFRSPVLRKLDAAGMRILAAAPSGLLDFGTIGGVRKAIESWSTGGGPQFR